MIYDDADDGLMLINIQKCLLMQHESNNFE